MADDLKFPKDAFVNPQGMTTVPEPEKPTSSGDDYIEHITQVNPDLPPARLLVPPAKSKPITSFFTDPANTRWEVAESVAYVMEQMEIASKDDSPEWYDFTDPAFGFHMVIRRSTLRAISGIIEDSKDMEGLQKQIEQAQYDTAQWRLQKLQLDKQLGRNSIRSN